MPSSLRFVRVIMLVFVLKAGVDGGVDGARTAHGKRGRYVQRMVAVRPRMPLQMPLPMALQMPLPMALPFPLFRAVAGRDADEQDEEQQQEEQEDGGRDSVLSPDYASTAPTSAQQDDEDDDSNNNNRIGSVRALDDAQSGRTFKHILMLRGLLGSGSGGYGSGSGGGGYSSIPYIIINQPLNFTNTNNNSLINNPPPTTTTTARRRTPVRYLPMQMPMAMPMAATPMSYRPTEVYQQRQSGQAAGAVEPHVSIALPATAAAAMFGLSVNDLLPSMGVALPQQQQQQQLRQRRPQSTRGNPFEAFAANLRDFQFF